MAEQHPNSPITLRIENFRDFGGCRVRGGGRVRTGRLFRSAHLHHAGEDDAATLGSLGITHVVDLRSDNERVEQPNAQFANLPLRTIFSPDIGENRMAAPDALAESSFTMGGQYQKLPFEPAHIAVFSQYFETLESAEGGVLIHCAAGKDRTGLLAALTLHLLDVETDDIETDYLLTNNRDIEPLLEQAKEYLERRTESKLTMDTIRMMLTADATWLRSGFDAIEARCGSIDAYFEDTLGVTPKRKQAIIERLVERAD